MKKLLAVLLSITTVICAVGCAKSNTNDTNDTNDSINQSITEQEPVVTNLTRDISTMELVREMGYGINLGNTLESCGDWIDNSVPSSYERAWGSPLITQGAIQGYADAGFGVLRIPVAWSNMMADDGTYTINPAYMARVKEVTDWALDTGMYVIINLHYDNGWMNKLPENKEEHMKHYTSIWTQVADAFKDYDDKLIFESQNEELGWDSLWNRWSGSVGEDKQSSYALVNEVNQTFVDIVRASGGQNEWRHLLISGYNTDVGLTCDELFQMPNDPADRMAVSVHYYTPSTLCILDKDASWGKARTSWGDEADLAELNTNMTMLKERFIDNGIPVIVGEYGCFGKNKSREVIENYLLTVSSAMYEIGACPVLWDTTGDEYNRMLCSFRDPEFIEELIKPAKGQ